MNRKHPELGYHAQDEVHERKRGCEIGNPIVVQELESCLKRKYQKQNRFPMKDPAPSFCLSPIDEKNRGKCEYRRQPDWKRIPVPLLCLEEVIEDLGWRSEPKKNTGKPSHVRVVSAENEFSDFRNFNAPRTAHDPRIIEDGWPLNPQSDSHKISCPKNSKIPLGLKNFFPFTHTQRGNFAHE
jgi:hypothetical protein